MMRTPTLEVADVILEHGAEYLRTHRLPLRHLRALREIALCRTAVLGGHVDRCDECGYERISYNSCRNRHCPKCGSLAKEKWLRARKQELLAVPYFHIVFTLPDDLNALALINQREIYTLLFQAAGETVLQLGRDRKHLGAEVGMIEVLHTWGQNLMDHPHVHCIVTGGGLSEDGTRWIGSRESFFIPVRVLSRVFRGKFLEQLKKAYHGGQLKCIGRAKELENRENFQSLLNDLYNKEWIVYAKRPFGGPEQVLNYLGRYTHRVAIANHRLVGMADGKVSFRWRDYRDHDREKIMTLEASEFLRRFLLHILPDGMCKIRYYGFLSNRKRKERLDKCRRLLDMPKRAREADSTWQEMLLELKGIDVLLCPSCHEGRMVSERMLLPNGSDYHWKNYKLKRRAPA
jgi:predicted Zn-ribbon and HTH transcriptional regulator